MRIGEVGARKTRRATAWYAYRIRREIDSSWCGRRGSSPASISGAGRRPGDEAAGRKQSGSSSPGVGGGDDDDAHWPRSVHRDQHAGKSAALVMPLPRPAPSGAPTGRSAMKTMPARRSGCSSMSRTRLERTPTNLAESEPEMGARHIGLTARRGPASRPVRAKTSARPGDLPPSEQLRGILRKSKISAVLARFMKPAT